VRVGRQRIQRATATQLLHAQGEPRHGQPRVQLAHRGRQRARRRTQGFRGGGRGHLHAVGAPIQRANQHLDHRVFF
jgi:hypothetical protein